MYIVILGSNISHICISMILWMIPVVIKVCTNFAKILQKNFTNKILFQVMLIQEMMVWLIIGDTLRRPTIILHINNKVITTNVVKCNHVNTKHPCDTIKTINYFSYRIISLFNLVFIYSFSNYAWNLSSDLSNDSNTNGWHFSTG